MKVAERYQKIFGSITHLSDEIPWTTGVSNMMEHLLWETRAVLGIPKTQFWKMVLQYTQTEEFQSLSPEAQKNHVKKKLDNLISSSEVTEKYLRPKATYCSAREALRRNKFFSEDYLNKEFDIFLNLCSDMYLDTLYQKFATFFEGGHWSTHGNSGLYCNSTGIEEMQMDNLAYNDRERILIANELKLGGSKNPDQLLKYSYMLNALKERGFIEKDASFLLLFIGDKHEVLNIADEIESEKAYCTNKNKHIFLTTEVLNTASQMSVKSLTWHELIDFNERYQTTLGGDQQVERKLLEGFNTSLKEKAFLQ